MKNRRLVKWLFGRRMAALLLGAVLLLGAIPASQDAAADDTTPLSIDAVKGEVMLLKWKRVRYRDDIPSDGKQHYAMLADLGYGIGVGKNRTGDEDASGWYYYATKSADNAGFPFEDYNLVGTGYICDNFWTTGPNFRNNDTGDYYLTLDSLVRYLENEQNGKKEGRDCPPLTGNIFPMLIQNDGSDSSNKDKPQYSKDGQEHKSIWYHIHVPIYDSNMKTVRYYALSSTSKKHFGLDTKFTSDTPRQTFHFQYNDRRGPHIKENLGGDDMEWILDGDGKFYARGDHNAKNDFAMWVAEEVLFSAINSDYVIRSGEVVNVDDKVILMEGKTITIEPGGVLSIEGRFFNNGTILNGGTIYLQEDSCLMPFGNSKSDETTGRVVCVGGGREMNVEAGSRLACSGDIVIGKGARMCLVDEGRLYLQEGATLFNNGGAVLLKKEPIVSSSTIVNQEGGVMIFGKTVESKYRNYLMDGVQWPEPSNISWVGSTTTTSVTTTGQYDGTKNKITVSTDCDLTAGATTSGGVKKVVAEITKESVNEALGLIKGLEEAVKIATASAYRTSGYDLQLVDGSYQGLVFQNSRIVNNGYFYSAAGGSSLKVEESGKKNVESKAGFSTNYSESGQVGGVSAGNWTVPKYGQKNGQWGITGTRALFG